MVLQGSINHFHLSRCSQDIAQDEVFSSLESLNKVITKSRLIGICGLSDHAVSLSLRNLRKKKKVSLYYNKYWGLLK